MAVLDLPGFARAVTELWEAMTDVVARGVEGGSPRLTPEVRRLHHRLVGFRSRLATLLQKSWPPQQTRVSPHQLALWARREDNQETLRGGLQQLSGIRDTLFSCIDCKDFIEEQKRKVVV